MNEIKGYVVRGTDQHGASAYAVDIGDGHMEPRCMGAPCVMPFNATALATLEMQSYGCADVRIYAVGGDGTETPIPTHAEALATLAAVSTAIPSSVVSWHDEHGNEIPVAERVRLLVLEAKSEAETATELAAARAENERQRLRLAQVFGGEAGEASHSELVALAAEELTKIGDILAEAGVEPRGPDDTLPGRVGRLVEDANEGEEHGDALDDVLSRIVAAWREEEVGQIDGGLIEEAERLLGIEAEADLLALEGRTRDGDDIVWPDGERWPTRSS